MLCPVFSRDLTEEEGSILNVVSSILQVEEKVKGNSTLSTSSHRSLLPDCGLNVTSDLKLLLSGLPAMIDYIASNFESK